MSKPRRTKAIDPTSAVIYLRVSTEAQARSGLGRAAQEKACLDFCARRGLSVVGVYVDDGLSGKLPLAKRPGLAAAVAATKETADCVFVVYAVSRFIRSQKECWALVDQAGEYALPLVSASEPFDLTTAMGRAFLGMLSTFAALESDLASERTIDALAAAKALGTKLGAPSMSTVLAPETIETVKVLYASGNYSHRSLAVELNERGIPTAQGGGKRWHPRTVRVALASMPATT